MPNPSTDDATDNVNHPKHYTSHPSGVECITITRHMSFNLGNAIKYIWRADEKGSSIEDLKKAQWYIADEIKKRSADVTQEIAKVYKIPKVPKSLELVQFLNSKEMPDKCPGCGMILTVDVVTKGTSSFFHKQCGRVIALFDESEA